MTTRRVPFDPSDPSALHAEQRLRELAAILAAGVIRMRMRGGATSARRCAGARAPQILPESGETRLEFSRRSSPDGQCG